MEIERLHPSVGLGGFARLPSDEQARLMAWYKIYREGGPNGAAQVQPG